MRLREAVAPLAAATALAVAVPSAEAAPETTTSVASSSPVVEALNAFRNAVLFKHRAQILMETCVSWPNDTGGTTVTWNPGLLDIAPKPPFKGKKTTFFAFTTHDKKYKPSWGPLNGPEISSPVALTLVFKPDHLVLGSLNRRLSEKEQKGKNGIRHYNDLQTGEPIMDTVLVNGLSSEKAIAKVCTELRDDKPVADSYGII